MELDIRVADPAGNRTVLVESDANARERAEISNRLLAIDALRAEQVGFIVSPKNGGDIRLEMMGGEFCGNALRSTGYYHYVMTGKSAVSAEISGCAVPLAVNIENGKVRAEMPLPEGISEVEIRGQNMCAVSFEGLVHLVAEIPSDTFSESDIRLILAEIAERFKKAAAGLMFFDRSEKRLIPAVFVCKTNTLYFENSCASGSAATAAYVALKEGGCELSLKEPGGIIEACARAENGEITEISISGEITMTEKLNVTI